MGLYVSLVSAWMLEFYVVPGQIRQGRIGLQHFYTALEELRLAGVGGGGGGEAGVGCHWKMCPLFLTASWWPLGNNRGARGRSLWRRNITVFKAGSFGARILVIRYFRVQGERRTKPQNKAHPVTGNFPNTAAGYSRPIPWCSRNWKQSTKLKQASKQARERRLSMGGTSSRN